MPKETASIEDDVIILVYSGFPFRLKDFSTLFSEVVNTAESASAPLGDVAGRAVSSSNHDVIHVHSDDYSLFMTVLVITPDEYYSQGVDKIWSRLDNAQQYLPILNNLSPDATLNKELYVSGNNSTDEHVLHHD